MLRYKTETRPGLVALYDIRPGNGAGQFLQPRSPHGALLVSNSRYGSYAWVETKVKVRIFQDPLSLSLSGGPGTPWVNWQQNVSILHFTAAKDDEGGGNKQLDL